jgi:hypothetical protein
VSRRKQFERIYARDTVLATDAFGDCYYIPLNGEKSAQCPVMCYHDDGSDLESVSTSLDEFVHRLEKTRLGPG